MNSVRHFVKISTQKLEIIQRKLLKQVNYRACKWVTTRGVTLRDWSLLGTKRD